MKVQQLHHIWIVRFGRAAFEIFTFQAKSIVYYIWLCIRYVIFSNFSNTNLTSSKIFLKSESGSLACVYSTCQGPAVVELSPREAVKIKIQKHPKCHQDTDTYIHIHQMLTIYKHNHLLMQTFAIKIQIQLCFNEAI